MLPLDKYFGTEFPRCSIAFEAIILSFFLLPWRGREIISRRVSSLRRFNSISRDSGLIEDNKLTANGVILIMN